MLELTDMEKEDCQKVINALMEYWWDRLKIKMQSVLFQVALQELKQEIEDE